jgi:hypothetical protein
VTAHQPARTRVSASRRAGVLTSASCDIVRSIIQRIAKHSIRHSFTCLFVRIFGARALDIDVAIVCLTPLFIRLAHHRCFYMMHTVFVPFMRVYDVVNVSTQYEMRGKHSNPSSPLLSSIPGPYTVVRRHSCIIIMCVHTRVMKVCQLLLTSLQ